jgi:GWxTD domain-containing protein
MLKPRRRGRSVLTLFVTLLGIASLLPLLAQSRASGPGQAAQTTEPPSEASRQWLEEVVPYIITAEEKSVFLRLSNEAERGKFIEAFWRKRDPNPRTPENEFKIVYYKRIAMANQLFGLAGSPGWRTDRGRIFILLGPPHEVRRDLNPTTSSVTMFQAATETWGYWNLENPRLPYNMEFTFTDKYGSGNYVLEKGLSLGQGAGGGALDPSSLRFYFDNLENIAEALRNPFENLEKMRGVVTTEVSTNLIPLRPEIFFFKGLEKAVHVPIIVEIPYGALMPKTVAGTISLSLTLLLQVQNDAGQALFEKSRDIDPRFTSAEWDSLKDGSFELQTSLSLSLQPGTYRLQLLVVDNTGGKAGRAQQSILLPDFQTPDLSLSDVLLSAQTEDARRGKAQDVPQTPERPLLDIRRAFRPGEEMEVYFEIYNLTLSGDKGLNDLTVEYVFVRDGQALVRVPPERMAPANEKDCRVQTSFRLKNFEPGPYTLEVKVTDGRTGQSRTKAVAFSVSR